VVGLQLHIVSRIGRQPAIRDRLRENHSHQEVRKPHGGRPLACRYELARPPTGLQMPDCCVLYTAERHHAASQPLTTRSLAAQPTWV